MNEFLFSAAQFIALAVVQGTPILFGSVGEIITEKSGNLNLGIPGIMYIGAISGVIGGYFYKSSVDIMYPALSILIPLLCCLLGSLLASMLYCFLTVNLRANQNVTGLALTTFGVGIGNFFGGSLMKLTGSTSASISLIEIAGPYKANIPIAEGTWFGKLFFSYGFMVYVSIAIAIVGSYVLKRTRVGLHLRAVGESPATADAAGIDVTKYKYFATCAGGMIAGMGGLYYVMDYSNGLWSNDAFGDRGWLAIALVIFAVWKPAMAIFGSYLFGALFILYNYMGKNLKQSDQYLIQMLPYLVTIIVLVTISLRKKREHLPPASLGLSYFREER